MSRPEVGSRQGYVTAHQQLQVAEKEVAELVAFIADAAAKLQNWKTVSVKRRVSGGRSLALPVEIDGEQWPTVEQFAESLIAWHDARRDLQRHWDALPELERNSLPAPEKLT